MQSRLLWAQKEVPDKFQNFQILLFQDSKLLFKLLKLLFKCSIHCSNYLSHCSITWSWDHSSNDRIIVQITLVTVQLPSPEVTVQITVQLIDVIVHLPAHVFTVHLRVHVFTVHFLLFILLFQVLYKLSFWFVEGTAYFPFFPLENSLQTLSLSFPSQRTNPSPFCISQAIFINLSKFIKWIMSFNFNQFSYFIIISLILFVAYIFHTSFTLFISSNFFFIILFICSWLLLYIYFMNNIRNIINFMNNIRNIINFII